MLFTLSGMITAARLKQQENRLSAIEVRLPGRVIEERLVHDSKTPRPRLVTLSGMVIVVRLVQ